MNTPRTGRADISNVPVAPATLPREPIAIIGIGCRFPGGADDPESFWQLLERGRDGITEIPRQRWNRSQFYHPGHGMPGKSRACHGGFLERLDRFDAQFFGISPREAVRMDPQQRLLLQTAWEAMEDGGQAVDRLAGSRTAVFVGISSWDYSYQVMSFRDRGVVDAYSNTGGSHSVAANRLSYCFDFRGPSAAVDTACSSSLLAVHLACQSIWNGDSPLALAGGVNALLLPDFFVAFSQLGVLSPDGRCKAFDHRANGYVRSEGAGVVLLKPLADALADRDPIYAVIRGTAVNQDGRTPGMTVPRQEAQEDLITEACRSAGVCPDGIDYVEAHGTGTSVGDPLEAQALGSILGANRSADQPCIIGSVKTNIGHLEAGAGIASLIKVALALQHRRIPASLHFERPNPQIDLDQLRLRIPVVSESWPSGDGPALAGINSFGYGGTNAHAIVEEAPQGRNTALSSPLHARPDNTDRAELIPLSARTSEALRAVAGCMKDFLDTCPSDVTLGDIASNATHRRTHHDHRLAIVARSKEELQRQLEGFASGEPLPETAAGRISAGGAPQIGYVFSGQGPQWWAMGRQLLEEEPLFREVIEQCDGIVRQLGPWSLWEELTADEAKSRMAQTSISQPSIFAMQVALAALWRSWGVEPSALVGHSVGEVAAAHLAGVFELQDAMRIIYQRGRCMDLASSRGRMLAASLSPDEARQLVADYGQRVTLAAVNSPTLVTLSGEPGPLERIAEELEQRQVFFRRLNVEYAFHSAQMDPVRDELLESLQGIQPKQASIPLYSTVTGHRVEGPELDAEYWWQNVRQMVRFSDALGEMAEAKCDVVIELSPHPVLLAAVKDTFQHRGQDVKVAASLRRKEAERPTLLRSLSALHTAGAVIDWSAVTPLPQRFVRLPRYPWQGESLWFESDECRRTRHQAAVHPLLGCDQGGPHPSWQNRLALQLLPYLGDHRVQGSTVFPAACYVEMTLAAARDVFSRSECRIESLRLANPCVVSPDRPAWVETRYRASDRSLEVHSRPVGQPDRWTLHSSAVLRTSESDFEASSSSFSPDEIRRRCPDRFDRQTCHAFFQQLGLDYGPMFQGIVEGWHSDGESLGLVELPEALREEADSYAFHPALLDACFQVVIPADDDFDQVVGALYLPFEIEHVRLFRRPTHRLWVHARMLQKTPLRTLAELDVYDEDRRLVLQVCGLRSQRAGGTSAAEKLEKLLYAYQWQPAELTPSVAQQGSEGNGSAARGGHWLLLADRGGVARRLASEMQARGQRCSLVYAGERFRRDGADCFYVDPASRHDMRQMLQSSLDDQPACRGIIHLWNLDAPPAHRLRTHELEAAQDPGVQSVLHLVQAWDAVADERASRLLLVTRGAQSVGDRPEPVEVAQSPVIGFGRVVGSEYPRLPCKLIDLDPAEGEHEVKRLANEVLAVDDQEDEIAFRSTARYVHRYVPYSDEPAVARGDRQVPYRLTVDPPGTLDGLALRTVQRRAPAAGEVEIQVVASALNFSDVMKALGLYPGLADGPIPLGAECSGMVSQVGPQVEGLSVGDEVIAAAPFALGSHVVTRAELVVHKPSKLSFEEAATIPIAFLTASYALEHLGRLEQGERILIHSASGGVGLAAVQLARQAGAGILATAGFEEKREFLRQQGIEHVMDSRSLAFADQIMERTGGQGVDLILNSLSGEAIPRGLETLAEYGRFLEIGKRDIHSNMRLGLRPFRSNLSFFGIDLDRVMQTRSRLLHKLFKKVVEQFEHGSLSPLPHHVYPVGEVVDAFRLMQQGKHIGKIVISMRQAPARLKRGSEGPMELRSDATYLITGGLGGFGLAVAQWMVDRGAPNLALMSRGGIRSAKARRAVAELESRGARVAILKGDVSREEDVRAVLDEIRGSLPPLRGVFHAAMVLEDGLLTNLDRDWMRRVMAPKVNGAWNLHTQTLKDPLDYFVLFSSLSSVFGHPGQGNYAAANAFLDQLTYYRRAQGLRCLTVNWGYLGQVGYLAERQELGKRLERQGILSFSVRQALDALERAIGREAVQVSVMNVDWSRWQGLGVTGRVSPRFAHLLTQSGSPETGGDGQLPSHEELRAAPVAQRVSLIGQSLRSKIAHVLGVDPEKLDDQTPLLDLGLDSLMGVELRNWIQSQMQVNLSIVEVMRSPSLSRVAELIGDELEKKHRSSEQSHPGSGADDLKSRLEVAPGKLLENLDELSSEQVDELLTALAEEGTRADVPEG